MSCRCSKRHRITRTFVSVTRIGNLRFRIDTWIRQPWDNTESKGRRRCDSWYICQDIVIIYKLTGLVLCSHIAQLSYKFAHFFKY